MERGIPQQPLVNQETTPAQPGGLTPEPSGVIHGEVKKRNPGYEYLDAIRAWQRTEKGRTHAREYARANPTELRKARKRYRQENDEEIRVAEQDNNWY
jgi:hypothetical protein